MSETYDRLVIFRYMINTGHSFQIALSTAKRPMKVPSVRNKYKSEQFLDIIDDLREEDSDSSSSDSDDGVDYDSTKLNMLKRAEEIYNQRELIEQLPTPPTYPPPPNTRRTLRPTLYRGEPKSAIERFFDFNQDERKPRGSTLRSTVPKEGLPKYTE